jgi:Tol biopolymer transport system component
LAVVGFGLTGELNRFRSRLHAAPKEIKIIPNTDRAWKVAGSPDGKYIAYTEMMNVGKPSAKSSLWTLEVATNRRVMIAPPANNDYSGLTYSPDGGDIFYVGNDDVLYRIPASGGEPMKLMADVGAFSLSPDGDKVAFWRALNSGETAVMVANMDGSDERVLASRKKPEFIDRPAWSPDGSMIACITGVNARNGQASVIGLDAATGEERRITDQKWDEFSGRMAWLPDGSGLIVSAPQIWQIPYPPGEARKVTGDPNYRYGDISVTADGKSLVTSQSAWRSAVWMMRDGDAGAAMPITSNEHDLYYWISWTPDARILYASNGNIWIMDGDGTNPKQLTDNSGMNSQPTASPDGHYIVFSSNRADSAAFNLWRMDIDGRNPVQITHGAGEGQPVCSPDGRWVVYSSGGPNTFPKDKTLWKTSIEGGEPVQLASRPSSGADISPDGALIACWYQEDSGTPFKIALIPIDGGPPIKILDATMSSIVPVHWRPDGKVISYVHTGPFVSNIWNQPVAGGPPQPLTQFTSELIGGLDWSPDGHLICSRRHAVEDVIMISDFR